MCEESTWKWYLNVPEELALSFLSTEDKAYFAAYYREAGLLRAWRRPFFRHHYSRTFTQAVRFLLNANPRPRIVDLGCGTGTQSLLLALLGASVVALDVDGKALAILEKRKHFYEEILGRKLKLGTYLANALEFNYKQVAPIDGIYSMFAFNLMQPSELLLDVLARNMAGRARLAILDGNRASLWTKIFRWRHRPVWSPLDMRRELELRGLRVDAQNGGVALPPVAWALLPYRLAIKLDQRLCMSMAWPVSCLTMAEYSKAL